MVIISLMILIIAIALTSNGNSSTISFPVKTGSETQKANIFSNKLNISPNSEISVEGISPILFTRLASIVFIFSGALSYNALYIQSIGSGISIYSGLYHVTVLSQSFDLIIYILASLILIPWSNKPKLIQSLFFNENKNLSSSPSTYNLLSLEKIGRGVTNLLNVDSFQSTLNFIKYGVLCFMLF